MKYEDYMRKQREWEDAFMCTNLVGRHCVDIDKVFRKPSEDASKMSQPVDDAYGIRGRMVQNCHVFHMSQSIITAMHCTYRICAIIYASLWNTIMHETAYGNLESLH